MIAFIEGKPHALDRKSSDTNEQHLMDPFMNGYYFTGILVKTQFHRSPNVACMLKKFD